MQNTLQGMHVEIRKEGKVTSLTFQGTVDTMLASHTTWSASTDPDPITEDLDEVEHIGVSVSKQVEQNVNNRFKRKLPKGYELV